MKKYRDISEVRPELCDLRKTGEKWRKTGDRRRERRRKREMAGRTSGVGDGTGNRIKCAFKVIFGTGRILVRKSELTGEFAQKMLVTCLEI